MASRTRDTILRALRSQVNCTVKELADIVGISPVSVRHHLINLQAEGLVHVEEVRHGVGRPHHTFSLTEKALEFFPSRYFRLTNRLLEKIKESLSDEKLDELLLSLAISMAEESAAHLKNLPLIGRVQGLVKILSEEGFEPELNTEDDKMFIRVLSCPYLNLAREHPEICMIDQSFIAKALSVPVERVTCIVEGDDHCNYKIEPTGEDQK
jgi:DeoR family suf operon transcriptional repressor